MPALLLILLLLALPAPQAAECWSIGRLKYSGGGDWYANPTSLPNLIRRVNRDLGANLCPEERKVSLLDGELYQIPILYLTGHGTILFTGEEREALRQYLLRGGLLIADDNYGLDSSFRTEMKALFPARELEELLPAHPVFHAHYDLRAGLPKVHLHDGQRPQLLGLRMGERTVLLYSYEADLGDGWEDPEVHNDPAPVLERALRMGVNLVAWYLQGQRNAP